MLPNLIYIGPDKSGSTWLFKFFKKHPDIYIPDCKDTYYFDKYYHKGKYWYEALFNKAGDVKYISEISHDYLFSDIAVTRMASDLNDNAKFISILRDPCDRSFSHYLYLKRSGYLSCRFEEAIVQFPEIITNSLYHKHLDKYKVFGEGRLLLFLFDQLKGCEESFAESISKSLNISFDHDLIPNRVVRGAASPRSRIIARFAKHLSKALRDLGLVNILGLAKHNGLINYLLYSEIKHSKPKMDLNLRKELISRYFIEDIESLEKDYSLDLSNWKC